MEISLFEWQKEATWINKLFILMSRRSRLLTQKVRNIGIILGTYSTVLLQAFVLHMHMEFMAYRLLIANSIIIVQEIVQRKQKKFDVTLNLMNANCFTYQLANLLTHSFYFICGQFVLYLILHFTQNVFFQIEFYDLSLILFIIIGVLANVCFSQFLALFFNQPNIGLGVFNLLVSYFSVYLFKFSFFPAFFLPNLFSSYAKTRQFHYHNNADPSKYSFYRKSFITNPMMILVLIIQIIAYFSLTVFIDMWKVGKLCAKSSLRLHDQFNYKHSIVAQLKHKKRDLQMSFNVPFGKVSCLYGRSESGKSQIIELLSQVNKSRFSGSCIVMGRDLLKKGHLLPFNSGICLEDDNLEESFTLIYHLCFLCRLRGLPDAIMYKQIFYLSKLLDLQEELSKTISKLSKGNRRKAAILGALLGSPSLIIVDEATRNLDPIVAKQLLLALHFFVHKTGKTFFFTCKNKKEFFLVGDSLFSLPLSPLQGSLISAKVQRIIIGIVTSIPYEGAQHEQTTIFTLQQLELKLYDYIQKLIENGGALCGIHLELLNTY